MFNVELAVLDGFKRIIANKQVRTEPEVAVSVKEFEERVRGMTEVLSTSGYDSTPRGYNCGIILYTAAGEFHITTARM